MADLNAVENLRVLDLGLGLAAALIARHFLQLGMQVDRWEPADEPFYRVYPAYATLRRGARPIDADAVGAAIAQADIVIVGGEDYPGLDQPFDAHAISRANPRAIVIQLDGGVDAEGNPVPAVDLLAQARSGLVFEHYSDRPLAWALPGPSYGQFAQALIGAWAALLVREDEAAGQIVHASLQHGAAMMCMPDRISFEHEDARSLAKIPYDVRQLIFPARDGKYIQFAMQRPGALARTYAVLGIPGEVDPLDTGAKRPDADPRDFFGDFELFDQYVREHDRDDLLKAFWANSIGADLVLEPGECWDDEQSTANAIIGEDETGHRSVRSPIRFSTAAQAPGAHRTPAANVRAEPRMPLAGKRVIAMGTFIAGPYVSRALVDLGADVIKVDGPGGDPNSKVYTAWVVSNSGKRSIVIDVKQPEGRDILLRLCRGADMIYNNFRPGVAERIGVDPATLRKVAPDAVTLECSAYGTTGPKSTFPGLDPISQAVTGIEVRNGGVGNPPIWIRHPVVDYTTGALGTIALLIASYEHRRSGLSVDAQVNLLNTAHFLMSELVQQPDGQFIGAPPIARHQLGYNPAERLYKASDGWLCISARAPEMVADLAAMFGFAAPDGTISPECEAGIEEAVGQMPTQQALEALAANNVWAAPAPRYTGAIDDDPAAVRAGLFADVSDPHFGRIVSTAPMFNLSRSPLAPVRRPPQIGENTHDILSEIGYSTAEIERFHARKIVA
ncbi:MAG: CoA transferase [Sphingobium sp.]